MADSFKVDLHLHTAFSDGILIPESLVLRAHQARVGLLSITDHDCLDALASASEKAKSLGMIFVDGVELNTECQGREVHLLGYGFDPLCKPFLEGLLEQRQDRAIRFKRMLEKLNGLGFELSERRVYEIAGTGALGRPHLALALIEKKVVKTVDEAFRKYLGHGKPAWISRNYWTPQKGISMLHAAGGLAVLAHPERGGSVLLEELVSDGLDGIEVYYPSHSSSRIRELLAFAEKHQLFVTVGSDYHGINPGEKGPGSVEAPREVIDNLIRILGKKGMK